MANVRLDRSYFAVQGAFAARAAQITGLPLTEACRLHTAFYALARDNDAGVPAAFQDFDPGHPEWLRFVEAVQAGADPVEFAYQAYLDGDGQGDDGTGPCFSHHYWPEERLVRIHFGNNAEGTGLRPEQADARRAELSQIFATVARDHPEAAVVRGTSWLYHLEAYRRLFPSAFIAGLGPAGKPHQFAALWCQLIDRVGVVKPRLAEPFLAAVAAARSMDDLDAAFPLDVLAATAPIEVFHGHFRSTRLADRHAPAGDPAPIGRPRTDRDGAW